MSTATLEAPPRVVFDKPTIGAIRRERGLPIPSALGRAERAAASACHENAWRLWRVVVGDLTAAGRATCPLTAAASARQTLARWADELTLSEADAITDELEREAEAARRRVA